MSLSIFSMFISKKNHKTKSKIKIRQIDEHLFNAIKHNEAKRVKQLLKDGADPNAKNNEGATPLLILVNSNNINDEKNWNSCFEKLIQYGANPDITTVKKYPISPLIFVESTDLCYRIRTNEEWDKLFDSYFNKYF